MLLGISFALIFTNPYVAFTKQYTHKLLGLAVIGLGAGMNIQDIGKVGLEGIGYTILGIALAFAVGIFLGKLLKVEKDTSILITVGTAICGGSAIAIIAPVIKARDYEVSVSLGIVFLLNAVALFLFPFIGHELELSQNQFGLWSALAIHDTSSVVGATLRFGVQAMEVGTTVKLVRALWIIPVAMIIGVIRSRSHSEESGAIKGKKPWFILGFLLSAALVTWLPELRNSGDMVAAVSRRILVLTLFFIGSGLTRSTLAKVGMRPFLQGLGLWIVMAGVSLFVIYFNLI